MSKVQVIRVIQASPDVVFQTVSDIANFSQAVPHIQDIEFLSETQRGIGTRFRETRLMRGREYKTELEVTEFVENERVRLVADEGGTIWDSVFTVASRGDGTRLTMDMEARPYKLMSKIITRLIQPVVQRGVEDDMDCVKTYCEAQCSAADSETSNA